MNNGFRLGVLLASTHVASVSPSAYSSTSWNARGLLHIGQVMDGPSLQSLVLVCVLMCSWRQARHASDRHLHSLASVPTGKRSVCLVSKQIWHSLVGSSPETSASILASSSEGVGAGAGADVSVDVAGVVGLDTARPSWATSSSYNARALGN